MGMDVSGKKPTSEVGVYFRRSVWGWHPLWDCVEAMAPDLATKVRYAHSNDGDGLNARDAKKLATVLEEKLNAGTVAEWCQERDDMLASMPAERCTICGGTGKRLPPPTCGPGDRPCNGCDAKGSRPAWETHYHVSAEDVREFATFVAASGGFAIW